MCVYMCLTNNNTKIKESKLLNIPFVRLWKYNEVVIVTALGGAQRDMKEEWNIKNGGLDEVFYWKLNF